MAVTYEWHLNNVDIRYIPSTTDAQILAIHWGCRATDEDTGDSVKGVGSISVEDENYIFPAATIKNTTKTQVFQWLNTKLGDKKEEIKDSLAAQLAVQQEQDDFVPID